MQLYWQSLDVGRLYRLQLKYLHLSHIITTLFILTQISHINPGMIEISLLHIYN